MKSYLVGYSNGNGYYCNCCRNTWETTEVLEFKNDEAAIQYAIKYNDEDTQDRDSKIFSIYVLEKPESIFERS